MAETAVTSFVIRFIQEQDTQTATTWRGLIRHVQTSEETHFTQIEDALQFMAKFVEMGNWRLEIDPP
ncbi:MAG: hypothetical protein R3E31_00215 [Chloroflexota bacterium]